jgi:hypothetical protein
MHASVPYAHAQHVLKGPFKIWNFYTDAEHTRKKPMRMHFQHIPKGTRFARCHFRAKKSTDFLGPTLPMALKMNFPASKSFRPLPYEQQVDKELILMAGVKRDD